MKMLARAGAILSALLMAACLPHAAHAQQTGLTITAPAGSVPAQAIYCDNGSGVTALCSFGGGGSSGVAQASTTSGQTGTLIQCATTTAAPTYTTATTNPCSTDTSGNIRVTSAGAATAANQTTANASLASIDGKTLAAVAPVATTAAVSCQVAKSSAGSLLASTLYSSVSGWFLVFNATSAPADGAVTPIEFLRYPTADVTMGYSASPPLAAGTGITICFSTTGPYTKTASATATISAKVQ